MTEVRWRGGRSRARPSASDRNTYVWIVVWQIAGLVALLIAPRTLPALDLPAWLWIAGLMLAWAGIGLRVWAIHTLGRDFLRVVTVNPDQLVVDRQARCCGRPRTGGPRSGQRGAARRPSPPGR